MTKPRVIWQSLVLAGVTLLAACAPAPPPVPTPAIAPAPRPEIRPQSAQSLEAQTYYTRVQTSLLTNGLLRVDGGGPDVPFTAAKLARNFLRIAFYQEYTETSGRLAARESTTYLHRWTTPIRYNLTFGASVPMEQRQRDQAVTRKYTNRLARLTGLGFSQNPTRANMHFFIVNEDERSSLGSDLRALVPGISQATLNSAINMPRETYCLAFAASPGESGTYAQAIIIIRGEHPDLMRRACLHEEIAQALGLPNDSPAARPSIFNDDSEFGLLTNHDEMLLRILYDPRLAPGMTEDEATPIVKTISAELIGGAV